LPYLHQLLQSSTYANPHLLSGWEIDTLVGEKIYIWKGEDESSGCGSRSGLINHERNTWKYIAVIAVVEVVVVKLLNSRSRTQW
jgi:hypothetical protein